MTRKSGKTWDVTEGQQEQESTPDNVARKRRTGRAELVIMGLKEEEL